MADAREDRTGILIVDDNQLARDSLARMFERLDFAPVGRAKTIREAEEALREAVACRRSTVVVLDICMLPEDPGPSLEFLDRIEDPAWAERLSGDGRPLGGRSILEAGYTGVIVYSSMATPAQIAEFRERGFPYHDKPEGRWEGLAALIEETARRMRRKRELSCPAPAPDWKPPGLPLVGEHQLLRQAYLKLRDFANQPGPILILGETGSGKDAAARAVHHWLTRPGKPEEPFRLQGQELSPESVEWAQKVLYGRVKNALGRGELEELGAFDHARNGVLFLDEFQDVSRAAQGILLNVLTTTEGAVSYRRFGSDLPIRAEAKVVCAMNEDPDDWCRQGRLRTDILRRLREEGAVVRIPPLRERKEDIPALARNFADLAGAKFGGQATLTDAALALLASTPYPWPTNVSGLKSVVNDAVFEAYDRHRERRDWVIDKAEIAEALGHAPFYEDSEVSSSVGQAVPKGLNPEQAESYQKVVGLLEEHDRERQELGHPSMTMKQRQRLLTAAEALIRSNRNRSKAATLYGVGRQQFQTWVRKLRDAGIDPDGF